MQKSFLYIVCMLYTAATFSQANTEVYLFDMNASEFDLQLTNKRNISNNKGYDSQPSFYNDNLVIFSSSRNGQTDIVQYDITKAKLKFINLTENGGEYSPVIIPNSEDISAVRLDNDGKQRLYKYDYDSGEYTELIADRMVAYYVWADEKTIVAAVIEESDLNLRIFNLEKNRTRRYANNVGRSLHKIPNTDLVSFISKELEDWWVSSINPSTGVIKKLFKLPGKVEDICWLNDGSALIPSKNIIYKMNPKTYKKPYVYKYFSDDNLQNITRITTNKDNTKLALVSDISAEVIVQTQLDAYNSRDIEGFLDTYTNDIKLYNFPDELFSEGKDGLRKSYASFFTNTPDLNAKILKRIVVGNKVIDHEFVTVNGSTFKAVAIYEVENGLISKVTFIR